MGCIVKILCISDTVVQQMENAAHLRRRYHDVELIISCGDMPVTYLEFVTSVMNVPLLYVRGNHDVGYTERPPGGENLHQRLFTYKGLTFYGIEGSIRYNQSPIQYTESEMRSMVVKAGLSIYLRKLTNKRPIDIFVTHAPAFGIHDAEDLPHRGFKAYLQFLDWYRPRYMVHGHVHTYDRRVQTETQHGDTKIININPVTLLEIEPE